MQKRADSGSNAAIFVAIMLALIILYVLFLPPEVREELLEGNLSDDGDGDDGDDLNKTLLYERPGTLEYISDDYRNHELPAFRLYATESGEVLKEQASLYLKNSAFEKSFASLTFSADEDNMDNYLLSFNVEQSGGRLLIRLNNEEIFNGELRTGSPQPISLPSDTIRSSNTLDFEVSSVGWAFWNSNEYLLKNLKVTADFTDTSTTRSEHSFYLSEEEKANLDRATLYFFPRCDTTTVGRLTIDLNGARIFSALADCGVNNYLPLNPRTLYEGENTLRFTSQQGSYLVDSLRIRTYLEEPVYPIYYFDAADDFFDVVDEDDPDNDELKETYHAVLKMRFPNEDKKQARILINGDHPISLHTRDTSFERIIDDYLVAGANSFEITPETSMDIIDLKVVVEDADDD